VARESRWPEQLGGYIWDTDEGLAIFHMKGNSNLSVFTFPVYTLLVCTCTLLVYTFLAIKEKIELRCSRLPHPVAAALNGELGC
jgi:hypothetical protein